MRIKHLLQVLVITLLLSACAAPRYNIVDHRGVVVEHLGKLDNHIHYYYVQPLNSSMPVIGFATINPQVLGDTIVYKTDLNQVYK